VKKCLLTAPLCVAIAATLAACGSSSSSPSPTPSATATASAVPTAVPIPTAAPFTSQASVVSVPSVAASVALPTIAGFSGSIDFGIPTILAPGTTISTTVSNVAPTAANVPALSVLRHALAQRESASANGAAVVLVYNDLLYSSAVTYAKAPSLVTTVPSADIVAASYYLALYDPTRPSLGWQRGFEGPAVVTGSTLAFSSAALTPFTFAANADYYLAIYATSTAAAAPTPAPSIAPIAPATATPGPSPTPTAVASATPTASPTPTESSQPSQPSTPAP